MKAISLTQPWASAVAFGSKRIETRSWRTHYRGVLAIHATKERNVDHLLFLGSTWSWVGALWPTGHRMGVGPSLVDALPFGAIVAVANLVDCRPVGSFTIGELEARRVPSGESDVYTWTERQMGDFSLGRWGWVLRDVIALAEPLPCRGHQGLWTPSDDLVLRINVSAVRDPA